MSPPSQPLLRSSQSTSCCSDRDISVPVFTNKPPSNAPVAENAQQEPHIPWFLTGVTAPFSLQSMASNAVEARGTAGLKRDIGCLQPHNLEEANSEFVMSEKGVIPRR